MKFGSHDLKRLDKEGAEKVNPKPKYRPPGRKKLSKTRRFEELCRRYGHNPGAVRTRMRKDESRTNRKPMTLREALRVPPVNTVEYEYWRRERLAESGKAWRDQSLRERVGAALERRKQREAREALTRLSREKQVAPK